MTKREEYADALRHLDTWEPYLLEHSGLPGPRANLELVQAVADVGTEERFEHFVAWTPERAPAGHREEFLAACGAVGLGRVAAEGNRKVLLELRRLASDPRWRVREGVVMGLQRLGASDMAELLAQMITWAKGNDFERRAVAAALCEPALLGHERDVRDVLAVLEGITEDLSLSTERKTEGFRALRKGLAYCWSVAVAADPAAGRPLMERWMRSEDPDVRWVMRQNLDKKRLAKAGERWVATWRATLGRTTT